jgi:acetolactate synthase-1/3 small subunit
METTGAVATEVSRHTLSVLVENKSGVLARVADLFARRGYNILSLAVAPTVDDRFSRITIVVIAEQTVLSQIVKQLFKLINVVQIAELSPNDSVERELMLATVQATELTRPEIMEIVGDYSAVVLAEGDNQITISVGGASAEIDQLEEALRVYGLVEIQRTGQIALPKIGAEVPILRAK